MNKSLGLVELVLTGIFVSGVAQRMPGTAARSLPSSLCSV